MPEPSEAGESRPGITNIDAEGVSDPSPTPVPYCPDYRDMSCQIRRLLFAREYDAITALLSDPMTSALALRVFQREAGRWERALVARAEGAHERRARRIARQARQEACRQTDVELKSGAPEEGSTIGIAGDFGDGSGDFAHLDLSTEEKMDGLEPLVLKRQADGGYQVVEGVKVKARAGGGWKILPATK
jgi:hypothetical protein